MLDFENEQRILSYITPDGIKLDIESDHCPPDKYITKLVDTLRSDFSRQKYKIQKEFGVVEDCK